MMPSVVLFAYGKSRVDGDPGRTTWVSVSMYLRLYASTLLSLSSDVDNSSSIIRRLHDHEMSAPI
jgi:hypothetical protein